MTLVLTAVPQLIGWGLTCLLSGEVVLICLRVFIGLGVGMGSAVTPQYIGEVSTKGLRGALGAANQLAVTAGIFLINLLGTVITVKDEHGEEFTQWRRLAGVCAGLA